MHDVQAPLQFIVFKIAIWHPPAPVTVSIIASDASSDVRLCSTDILSTQNAIMCKTRILSAHFLCLRGNALCVNAFQIHSLRPPKKSVRPCFNWSRSVSIAGKAVPVADLPQTCIFNACKVPKLLNTSSGSLDPMRQDILWNSQILPMPYM